MGGVRPGRVFTGWFVLVVLYTVLTESDRLSEALGIGNSALAALSDPSRPLIRDHTGTVQNSGAGKGSQSTYTGKAPGGSSNPGGSPSEGTGRFVQPNPGGSPTEGTDRSTVHPAPTSTPSFLQRH